MVRGMVVEGRGLVGAVGSQGMPGRWAVGQPRVVAGRMSLEMLSPTTSI